MPNRRLNVAVFLALLLGAPTSARQRPAAAGAAPAGLIAGQTLDGVTGKPMGGAIVSLALQLSQAGPAARTEVFSHRLSGIPNDTLRRPRVLAQSGQVPHRSPCPETHSHRTSKSGRPMCSRTEDDDEVVP